MSFNNQLKNGIVILGAGNVATHLSIALYKAGFNIQCVYSQTIQSAERLAKKLHSSFTNNFEQIPRNADLYIISVKDEVIVDIIRHLNFESGAVVHTAGSVSMDIFQGVYENYGVFYPLQTFSKSRELEFSEIHIYVEANNSELENKLIQLAHSLSNDVSVVDSDKRKMLHLAAVFACNFVNHMYSIAAEILNDHDISFKSLIPLIKETAYKAVHSDPRRVQTGPALRNDQNVIQMHMEMLKKYPEFDNIYKFVSESIYELNLKNNNESNGEF